MSREPVRASYDAIVDVLPLGAPPVSAYALVKRTYHIGQGQLTPAPAAALYHDLRDPRVMPRLVPGCEFYPFKEQTDLVVRGYAFAAKGVATAGRTVSLRVADRVKTIDVIGRRLVKWEGNRPRFTTPEKFTQMPMTWREAYGGVDTRVPYHPDRHGAHPGVYPRNPLGKGFLVLDAPAEVELPNLEDPSHRLTGERLIVGDPRRWWSQPLPWCFEYTLPLMFPRRQWLGAGAAISVPPDAELEEVYRGLLSSDLREAVQADEANPPPQFYQEAPFGQSFAPLEEGVPITIEGMSPDRDSVTFHTPKPPAIEIIVEGAPRGVAPILGTALLEPSLSRASFVWIGRLDPLPKELLARSPGRLPLAVSVDGDEPIEYDPPGMDFVDVTAPLGVNAPIPGTSDRSAPPKRPAITTLRLTEAQLRGEEPVPLREDTSPEVEVDVSLDIDVDDPLTMPALGDVVGAMDDIDDVTVVEPLDDLSKSQAADVETSGRHTLVDPDELG